MSAHLIEFHTGDEEVKRFPAPYPAGSSIPQWFKEMPAEASKPGVETVKRCPPFLEAMNSGYIIPFPADVHLHASADKPGELEIRCEKMGGNVLMVWTHQADEFPTAPFSMFPVLKFMNPWVVRTPPGYSVLFLPPINRFADPIQPLIGVVETDKYYNEVHFPAVCLLEPGASYTLRRGTPMIQLIPFKRDDWSSAVGLVDTAARDAMGPRIEANRRLYKEEYWVKRSFT